MVSDPAFTGRSDVRSIAFENVVGRALTGFGPGAFWGTPAVLYGGQNASGRTSLAGDAHDGYAIVELCIPDLFLTISWLSTTPSIALPRFKAPLASEPTVLQV